MQWISLQRGVKEIDPGEVDGKFGSKSKAALKAFRKHFNDTLATDAGFGVDEDAERFLGDFHAFFFLYDLALQAEIGTDAAGVADLRRQLHFAPIGAMGCGESWTIEAIGEDDHPSKRNRRVDILLLEPGGVPELHALPVGLVVYGLGRFELKYLNQKIRVPVLDLADEHFRTNRSVMVPAPKDRKGATKQDDTKGEDFERSLSDLFKVLERFPKKQVLVAGHADSVGSESANDKLSADRAESVAFYVFGKKSAWVDHAQTHAADEDYQQVLTWVVQVKPDFGCDPGGIDNDFGAGSKRALTAFKKAFNREHGTKLPEDGTKRKDDWAAFFDVYDDVISAALGIEGDFKTRQKALDDRRGKIKPTDPAAIGCGEHFTIDKAGEDAVPSRCNRRVDVLLFDEGEVPPIGGTDPPGEAIYGMGRFEMVSLFGTAPVTLRLDIDPNSIRDFTEAVQLVSADGRIRVSRKIASDGRAHGDHVDVVFDAVPRDLSYSLSVVRDDGSSYVLFDAVPFDELDDHVAGETANPDTLDVDPFAPEPEDA